MNTTEEQISELEQVARQAERDAADYLSAAHRYATQDNYKKSRDCNAVAENYKAIARAYRRQLLYMRTHR